MTRMLKKALENILTAKESDQLVSAFDQIGDIIIVRIPDSLICLLYTSPSPRDLSTSRMPSSA